MTGRIYFCLMAVAMCLWSSMASAFSLNLNSYEFTFGRAVFTVMPGETVEVPVYLQETVGLQDTSVLAVNGVGIVGAGVQVIAGDFPQPTDPARVRDLLDIIPNPDFDVPMPSLFDAVAKVGLGKLEGPAVYGEECSQGVYRLLLGTFRFTAGDVPDEATPIRATGFDSGFANFVADNGRVLDSSPLPEAGAIIMVVPEPGSLIFLVAAMLVGMAWRIRLKKSPAI